MLILCNIFPELSRLQLQEKLADAIDSHQVYISEIEKGIKLPSLTIINNIAKAFDISLTHFMSRVEKKLDESDTEE